MRVGERETGREEEGRGEKRERKNTLQNRLFSIIQLPN